MVFGVPCIQFCLPVLITGCVKISSEFLKWPVAVKGVCFTNMTEMGRSISGSVQLFFPLSH